MFADSSDDPYLQVHAIDAEARYGDLEVADEYLKKSPIPSVLSVGKLPLKKKPVIIFSN